MPKPALERKPKEVCRVEWTILCSRRSLGGGRHAAVLGSPFADQAFSTRCKFSNHRPNYVNSSGASESFERTGEVVVSTNQDIRRFAAGDCDVAGSDRARHAFLIDTSAFDATNAGVMV